MLLKYFDQLSAKYWNEPYRYFFRILFRTGTIAGNILFGLAFFMVARKMASSKLKDSLILTGIGDTIVAIAYILLLTLKMSDLHIDGTKIVAEEIYRCFIELGSKAFLLYNMVEGYCVPQQAISNKEGFLNIATPTIYQPPRSDIAPVTQ
jgi:hypothetical protein